MKYVEDECRKETNVYGMTAFDHHFKDVVKYAGLLARECWANEEIVLLSAWLHDVWSIQWDYENHHIASAVVAEELLRTYFYPPEKIAKIRHCIIAHRWSRDIPRETIEAECIADADAMSHFDEVDSLFYLALVVKKMNAKDAKTYIKDKLQRSYNKLTPRAKNMIRPKYDAFMLVLE